MRLGDLLKTEDDTILNKEDLDSLFYSIQRAIRFDKEKKNYDPFEILSFAEVGVLFIKREFYEQTKKKHQVPVSGPEQKPISSTY